MSKASSTDAGVNDSSTKGTLLTGHDKRTAFKNRWLSRGKSSGASPEQGDGGPETAPLKNAVDTGDGRAAKNRWLKTILTTNVLRRNSSKCTEELAQAVGIDVDPKEVCLMSDSPYYVLTVSDVHNNLRKLGRCIDNPDF
jgi:hypothetical protein